jgi:hypothetical protein
MMRFKRFGDDYGILYLLRNSQEKQRSFLSCHWAYLAVHKGNAMRSIMTTHAAANTFASDRIFKSNDMQRTYLGRIHKKLY